MSSLNRRVSLFDVEIDAATMEQATSQLLEWATAPHERCRYVVTPNVDHAVMLRYDERFRKAYRSADLVVADGWPVVWASQSLGRPLPELVPGSDLTPSIFGNYAGVQPLRVFLLGAMPGVAKDRAARNIEQRWPNVSVAGVDSPPLGFENSIRESERIVDKVNAAAAQILVLGFGAPKQELWVYRHRRRLKTNVALCVGATIDFLAGEKRRAPRWMRSTGLEWLHRVATEPRRLARRYFRDAQEFPKLVYHEWRNAS